MLMDMNKTPSPAQSILLIALLVACFGLATSLRAQLVTYNIATADSFDAPTVTYIHLNPVRSGLIRIGQESLQNYRWSSYPAYLVWKRHQPKWRRVDRVWANILLV